MIKAVVAIAGSTAAVCAPAAWANTYVLGGTGQDGAPTQAQMQWLVTDGYVAPDTLIGIDYPADLWPVTGPLTLDKSVTQGTDSLDEVLQGVTPETSTPTTVVGISQGAVVINYEKRRAAASDPNDDITFVTLGDPTNSDGGLLAKLPPVHIPILDFTFTQEPVATPHDTIEVVREYDGFADWPDRPFNVLADLNALAGTIYVHPYYAGIDLHDEDNVVTQSTNTAGGTTTHILVKTDHLPITQPLRDVGVNDEVVDAIDKPLRKVINVAYDGERPGRPASAQPLNNVKAASNASRAGSGVRSVLKQIGSNLKKLGDKPHRQPQQDSGNDGQTGDPSADAAAD